jgi:PPM family protein phosphatase
MRTPPAPQLPVDATPSRLSATTVMEGEMSRRIAPSGLWGTATHQGHTRPNNEDAFVVEPDLGLYAVLDGMGGENSGEVASALAAKTLAEFVRANLGTQGFGSRDLLESAVNAAAVAVFDMAARTPEHHRMGTTVVSCLFCPAGQVLIAHAGDSRAYLLRNRQMRQLTRDHTLWQQYADEDRELSVNGDLMLKHILTRNLGAERGVVPDIFEETLEADDRLLLSSDGLHEAVSFETMQQILSARESPSHIARRLIEAALGGPCPDNVSALVLDTSE